MISGLSNWSSLVLKLLKHDDIGHLGFDKSHGLVRGRFYWPRMKLDVEKYCKTCERSIKWKTLPRPTAPLSRFQSSGPMDLVCIDFLSIESDSQNVSNVLVVTDHFTRYAQAFPTRDHIAVTVAKTLWEKYFIHYGLPTRIHSDQGRNFESWLVTMQTLGFEPVTFLSQNQDPNPRTESLSFSISCHHP